MHKSGCLYERVFQVLFSLVVAVVAVVIVAFLYSCIGDNVSVVWRVASLSVLSLILSTRFGQLKNIYTTLHTTVRTLIGG